jgi:hypothetical protein
MARRGPIPPAQTTQRPNRRRLRIMLGVLGGIVYVALQALSGAALFYLSNPALFQSKAPVAPSGWHIATPPGQATNSSYAVSLDTPGLILACGVTLSTSLTSFGKWSAQLWRTGDGGAHWRTLQTSFLKGKNECEITAISGSQTTFFAYGQQLASSVATSIWVTHDSGETWTRTFTAQADYPYYKSMRELSASVQVMAYSMACMATMLTRCSRPCCGRILDRDHNAGVSYVAAASGMEARLVVAATRQPRSWLDFFGGNARNLTTSQLLWTPAT